MFFLCCVFMLINLVSADVVVNNVNVENDYLFGEMIKGNLNLSFSDLNVDTTLYSSRGESIKLLDLINSNGLDSTCIPYSCEPGYVVTSSRLSRDIILTKNEQDLVGFFLNGTDVGVSSIYFSLSSDFNEGFDIPLQIDFFNYLWSFSQFSDNLFSTIDYSYYSPSSGSFKNSTLSSTKAYCSEFNIPKTDNLIIGADLSNIDSVFEETMYLYSSGSSPGVLGTCEISNISQECNISREMSAGNYYVCIYSDNQATNYVLKEENSSLNKSGFETTRSNFNVPTEKVVNYGIYMRYAGYAAAPTILLTPSSLKSSANTYLYDMYGDDCSHGCILPVKFLSGANQNINLENVYIVYTNDNGTQNQIEISSLSESDAVFSFEGNLDLALTKFPILNNGNYVLSIGGQKIYENVTNVVIAPTIEEIYPINNIPTGVEIEFRTQIDNADGKNITYNWKIPDVFEKNTTVNTMKYTFYVASSFLLNLTIISDSGYTASKVVTIKIVSPDKKYLESAYKTQSIVFTNIMEDIESLPIWYTNDVWELLNITYYKGELERLGRILNVSEMTEAQKNDVILSLYNFDLSDSLFQTDIRLNSLHTQNKEVNLQTIVDFLGITLRKSLDEYALALFNWQSQYIDSKYSTYVLTSNSISGAKSSLFRVYDLDINSSYVDKSYLILERAIDDLTFEESYDAKTQGSNTIIGLGVNEKNKNIKFYANGLDEVDMFFATNLNDLVLESDIDNICNNDGICDSQTGENFRNCRSDCIPVGSSVKYIILILFLVLCMYTGLQFWYSRYYENSLFKEKTQLSNLLKFIEISMKNGSKESEIKNKLLIEGWAEERIIYAINKNKGKKILPEIIPITKIIKLGKEMLEKYKSKMDKKKEVEVKHPTTYNR